MYRQTTSYLFFASFSIALTNSAFLGAESSQLEGLQLGSAPEKIIHVPDDYDSIQAAIDAAPENATILISPGVYHEGLRIEEKTVHLVSRYLTTQDRQYIGSTVVDGSIPPDPNSEDDDEQRRSEVIYVAEDAGPDTTILGLTIRDGDDGIACHAKVRILLNRFVNNVDAIDYEGGGGECRFNEFVANDDDAVDLDGPCEVVVADNQIRDNDDDGIEIRLQPYTGKTLQVVVRNNQILGNGEDGIQIIDYPELSDRNILIERNVIARNAMAGIGFMADANTKEDYEGAAIPEPIAIVNNTIAENHHGMAGGGNLLLLNNIICKSTCSPLKNLTSQSTASHNLLWANGAPPENCILEGNAVLTGEARIGPDFKTDGGYEWINAGTLKVDLSKSTQAVLPSSFEGPAPDLGAYEIR